MKPAEKIIVALDTPSIDVTKKLLKELDGLISFYKIGFELFTEHGWKAVELVKKFKGKIFLDLKLHDIPNTVSKTAAVICEHEIEMFNVHALGGLEMMRKTREIVDERVKTGALRPLILGVTILTSHKPQDLPKHIGIMRPLEEQVVFLAEKVQEAGLDGVISSPQEIKMIRAKIPKPFHIITPGVRPVGSAQDDQIRTFTPSQAVQAGADYLVIGRPIVSSENPRKAASEIIKSIEN